MSSSQKSFTIDPKILGILKIIWSGKWKIILITIVITLISFYYGSKRPDLYSISILIKKSPPSEFSNLMAINDILLLEGYPVKIDPEILAKKFISEFKTLNVLKQTLEKNSYIKGNIANLDDESKQKFLLKIARSLEINHTNNNENIVVSIKWHSQNEGLELLNNSIKVALERVKKSIINEIVQINKTISFKDKNRLKELEDKKKSIIYFKIKKLERELIDLKESLEVAKKREKKQVEKRIIFLKEQSDIAKYLDIKNGIRDTIRSGGYYLRGYTAIDKEIDLIQNRSIEQNILSIIDVASSRYTISYLIEKQIEIISKRIEKTKNQQFNQSVNSKDLKINNQIDKLISEHTIKPSYEYIGVQQEINEIKNNSLPAVIKEYQEIIDSHDPQNWISYNYLSANVISLNASINKVLAFGVISGMLMGIFFVLLSNIRHVFFVNK